MIARKKAPEAKIASHTYKDGVLSFSLITAGDTVKAEVYMDGKLAAPPIAGDFGNCAVKLGDAGGREVEIRTFDRFLNRCDNRLIL